MRVSKISKQLILFAEMVTTEAKQQFFGAVAHDKGFHAQSDFGNWDSLQLADIIAYEVPDLLRKKYGKLVKNLVAVLTLFIGQLKSNKP